MRVLYTLFWYSLLPFLYARLWWRGRKAPAYRRRWRERLALGPGRQRLRGAVWIHAVSVGETLAAAPLIRALLEKYPDTPLVVTTTTPTGSERVRALFGDSVTHVYCPWDIPGALSRFFRAFDPRLVLVMETELWPNMVAAARRREVPVMLVNGRLSERSFRGYARFGGLVRDMMASFQRLMVQTGEEAERFRRLGARADAVTVTGSIKFDLDIGDDVREQAASLRRRIGQRPVWIAASTHAGEDGVVLKAHRRLLEDFPDALLVLVPRHPERFQEMAFKVEQYRLSCARRSADDSPAHVQVYLADTMGELLMLFGTADVAFVGGSLVPVGGHNLLEPAAWHAPVLTGPHLHNFQRIADLLDEAGGLTRVRDADALSAAVGGLFADGEKRRRRGEAAAGVVAAHRGALQRVLSLLAPSWPA